ncbi:MAG: carbamoyl-phosphate synthase large subunit [Phycisphaerae bacterium]|nr:carbamoyl-phosphate synthase large subunit [Phycisphaerae bacterium]
MPRRADIRRTLIIGSGPIVIGQACEFDYSGAQACKALREEGIAVVLVNSNPATIMTDPELADRTYVEPITPEVIEKILEKERVRGTPIDSVLPTLGGQTGLNCAMRCHESGVFERLGVRMLAASPAAIHKAENRQAFRDAMRKLGLDVPASGIAHTWDEAKSVAKQVGLPCCIRPAFTLGGSGGGFAWNAEEFEKISKRGLEYSPVSEILIEESLWGWKEYELEVMRDRADNVVIICAIENFDPMGVHTGDSITVAPAQTLTDREYQRMRNASLRIIREIGVETGGSNIQFGVHPKTGRMCVIEMNPRVSRSSALASKATGFPIAKIATKLAIGYTLDELPNDITRNTPACFEPALDYCVVKIPRWTFEKFPEADETLTTQMKSVGEAMAIGRTFKEALQKCVRSMEIKRFGLGLDANDRWLVEETRIRRREELQDELSAVVGGRASEAPADTEEERAARWPIPEDTLIEKLRVPAQGRLYYIRYALKHGMSVERICELSGIDPWFVENIRELVAFENELLEARPRVRKHLANLLRERDAGGDHAADEPLPPMSAAANGGQAAAAKIDGDEAALLMRARSLGYSEMQLANIWDVTADQVRALLKLSGLQTRYRLVDTCAAEFEAATPYYYGTAECAAVGSATAVGGAGSGYSALPDELRESNRPRVVVLGGGPNRIGQGIEFDYCCVHAAQAARELGYDAVMVNSNPETVSTDYDTSDMLFFEPLTHEDVLNICERLAKPKRMQKGVAQQDASSRRDSAAASGNLHSALLKGVIVQFGGQTPLNLARGLQRAGVPILGTSPDAIHRAEDREEFARIIQDLGLQQPPSGIARNFKQAKEIAERVGYPVLVRPSYVLGGRAMEVCNAEAELRHYMTHAVAASGDHPILIDRFLSDAIEVDVDAVCDGQRTVICGVLEHIEEAGIHSGDSMMTLPPYSLSAAIVQQMCYAVRRLAIRIGVIGLMNVQFAIKDDDIYVLEVNPRASRTVPFISKATGIPWARVAAKVMLGKTLAELGITEAPPRRHIAVKQSVFPFDKFPGVDVALGPEMRSTGEVMGIDERLSVAFAKAMMAASVTLPLEGKVFVSVNDKDKPFIAAVCRPLAQLGFELISTEGTGRTLRGAGLKCEVVQKIRDEAGGVTPLDLIESGQIKLVLNTPARTGKQTDEGKIRAAAASHRIPIVTTITGARAAVAAIGALKRRTWDVHALQDLIA